jgi:hypothetical protein
MFLVLIAGLFGYAIGGWLGVAIGALAGAGIAVLSDAITPPRDRETAHERRMRANRRYRTRYEALEMEWRGYRPAPREPSKQPVEIVPLPAAEPATAAAVNVALAVLDEPETKSKTKPRQVRASRRSTAT